VSSPGPEPAPPAPDAVRMSAVHLGGIQGLTPGQRDLELRFSSAGVQIHRQDTHQPVGTLAWSDIRSVRLPRRRSLRRRPPRIEVQSDGGRARFSLPGLRAGQVRAHLAPLLAQQDIRLG
jgi:hypothetical protein